MAAPKMTKNQMRRAKKKEQKKVKAEIESKPEEAIEESTTNAQTHEKPQDAPQQERGAVVEADSLDAYDDDPAFAAYKAIFTKFNVNTGDDASKNETKEQKGTVLYNDDDDIPDEDQQPKPSKKKRKALNQVSVAQLKALAAVPEVVEWQDVSSTDPRVLVQIKSQRNVVPVPAHWSLKREYLSSKRGIEKSAFRLPQFIAETGIAEMRDAVLEKQAEQTLKQKQRERVAPKMGRLDIDYQKLYDAFFRFQTKPELTRFGEVYYEGKETEVDYQHFRPGDLSEATKEALGIPPGAPPPWLVSQQRYGPPPSYPNLKIPGLNAPPPPGGAWGFHPGGWGKPPVDEFNRPLYGGDVFGITGQHGAQPQPAQQQEQPGVPVERTLWGELQPRAEESEEEEESEDESDEEEGDNNDEGQEASGLETPSGFASTLHGEYPPHGTETSIAGEMDLRKERRGYDTEESSAPRSAYAVLPERQVRAEGFFGSDRAYDMAAAQQQQQQQQRAGMPVLGAEDDSRKRKKPGDVDVAVDVDALNEGGGLSKEELRRRFEAGTREEGVGAQWAAGHDDDLADMIAEEGRKRQRLDRERMEKKKEGRRH
ncbi:splicing factor 3b [Cordyceps fumosorosea ARSEF 2679]|uniref:Splicing factor 3b n=1 Tax=Cordyceps fumosorosea (strain ARSEF 2679) TaxID=1081104 RepID=A0A167XJX5_CORFA|nr:splicing factor 3b [Cordyceps fumosorosea ARSEF 2679]OAA65064.1 splicing factor 3b [Cordyceps fumosorosea ARSEF 2679]